MVGKGIGIGGKRYRYWWEKVSVLVGKGIGIGGKRYIYALWNADAASLSRHLKVLKIKELKIKKDFVEKLVFDCLIINQLKLEIQSKIWSKSNLVGKGSYMSKPFT